MRRVIKRTALFSAIAACSQLSYAALSNAELEALVKAQAERIDQLEEGQAVIADEVDTQSTLLQWASKTSLGGYGEHHYNNNQGTDGDQVDAHRFVLYIAHQYSETIRFFSEVELEHSLAGEGKPGEVELEQAFIEWDYSENHSVQFGQFLIPVGILNETHEPDTFYGTERNKVESEIIPATWWETGVMLTGELSEGLSYNFAVHSGLEVPVSGDSNYRIRSGRQKSAEATADDLAATARIKYASNGVELAATVQHQSDITQGSIPGETQSATLFETHAVATSGPITLKALYAQWDVDSSAFEAAGVDTLSGFYVEPSYKITEKLGVFARYSEWERGDKATTNDRDSVDVGLNYWLNPNVVLKADYSDFSTDVGNDTFNLGVGWSF